MKKYYIIDLVMIYFNTDRYIWIIVWLINVYLTLNVKNYELPLIVSNVNMTCPTDFLFLIPLLYEYIDNWWYSIVCEHEFNAHFTDVVDDFINLLENVSWSLLYRY